MKRLLVVLCVAAVGCTSREVVTIYSPHGPDMLKDYEALFEAAYPEIDLQWLDMGSQDVYNRVNAEKNRPACDVWWGGPASMFMQAAEGDLLASYEPAWSEAIDPANRDALHRWYGTHMTPLSILFNNRHYTRAEVPQTWDALVDGTWDGKITIRHPQPSGTMRTFIGAMMQRAGSEEAGIAYLKRLHAGTEEYLESPQLLFDHIKRNEELITVWIMPDAVLQRERNGYPFDFYIPNPTPTLTEGIAIVKGGPNPENAKLFFEFVTTKEALIQQAEEYAKIPARTDIDPEALPAWMHEQDIVPMKIDWIDFANNEQARYKRWETEVYNAK